MYERAYRPLQVELLKMRAKLLNAVSDTSTETVANVLEDIKKTPRAPLPLPNQTLQKLKDSSISELRAKVRKLGEGAESERELSLEYDEWTSDLQPLQLLVQACHSSCSGLTAAQKSKQKQVEAQERKMVASAKRQAASKQKAKAATTSHAVALPAAESTFKLFDMPLEKMQELPVHPSMDDVLKGDPGSQVPFVIRNSEILGMGERNPCRINLLVFFAALTRNTAMLKETRVLLKGQELHTQLYNMTCDPVEPYLLKDDLNTTYMFGSKRGCKKRLAWRLGLGIVESLCFERL